MAKFQLEHRVTLGTDVASFFLYHPDDFPGNPGRPLECLNNEVAWKKEAGKVIAFCTGSDGAYTFRLTRGSLTKREQRWRSCSAEFLYTVHHGKVVLDSGFNTRSFSFDIPNGHYRVTLHALDWWEEPGVKDMPREEQLPSYVVCFEAVADPSSVNAVPWPPRMDSDGEPTPAAPHGGRKERRVAPPSDAGEGIFIVEKDVLLFPGTEVSIDVSKRLYDRIWEDSDRKVIVAPLKVVPTWATAASVSSGGNTHGSWSVSLLGDHLVSVTKTRSDGRDVVAQYAPLKRPASRVKPAAVAKLRAAFERYARSNPRGLHLDSSLEFTLEELEASRAPERFAWWLLAKLPIPKEERFELATVAFAEQCRALHAWLTSPERAGDVKKCRARTDRDREFLAAIIENPEDDGPRIAYANWLKKQGDPRGEFIHLGCKMAKKKERTPPHNRLRIRIEELLKEYGKEWKGPFEKLGIECDFRRGFIESPDIAVNQFLQKGEKLMEHEPFTSVRLTRFDPRTRRDQFKSLAACPLLARLWELKLFGNQIDDREIAILAKSPYLANLQRLSMDRNQLGQKGVQAIANSPHLANLRGLSLRENYIDAADASALAASTTLRNLEELDLRGTVMGDAGLRALARSKVVAHLKTLLLGSPSYSKGNITARGVAELAKSQYFSNLELLVFDGADVGDAGAVALAKSRCLKNLKHLGLSGCGINHIGAEAIASSAGLASLERLVLSGGNKIDDRAVAALVKMPHLKSIRLSANTSLTDAGKKLLRKRFGKEGYSD